MLHELIRFRKKKIFFVKKMKEFFLLFFLTKRKLIQYKIVRK